ncbi:hypothetical protein PV328_012206, partial [Microctonus aethiopoides]
LPMRRTDLIPHYIMAACILLIICLKRQDCDDLGRTRTIKSPWLVGAQKVLESAFYALDEWYPERSFPQRELVMRFGLLDLKTRIDMQDVLHLFKLLNDKVNCSELSEQIGIRAPRQGLQ